MPTGVYGNLAYLFQIEYSIYMEKKLFVLLITFVLLLFSCATGSFDKGAESRIPQSDTSKQGDASLSDTRVLAEEIEAGTTLFGRDRIALSDKIRLDKTMDNLFSLTQGEAIGYGEAESALLKLKALARAAEEEYEIAKAVDDYASVTDASREAKAETERRLHNAENAYKAAYNEYRILCENLSDDDIQRAREKLQAAYKNLEDAKEGLSEAEKENASLMSLKSEAKRDMIERMILLFADTYSEKNTAVLQAARNYYLAKFSEQSK